MNDYKKLEEEYNKIKTKQIEEQTKLNDFKSYIVELESANEKISNENSDLLYQLKFIIDIQIKEFEVKIGQL